MGRYRSSEKHPQEDDGLKQLPLTSEELKKLFSSSADVIFRSVQLRSRVPLGVTLVYVDGLTDQKMIDDNVIRPLSGGTFEACSSLSEVFKLAQSGTLQISGVTAASDMAGAVSALLSGHTLLCFDKPQSILTLATAHFEKRMADAANEEVTYRAAKESFVETLRVNTSMLRRKIPSASLVMEETTAGRQSNTRICIVYMRNICNESFITEVHKNIGEIDQDRVIAINDITTNVVRQKFPLFPTAVVTEKPEICARHLLDGKIAVIAAELPYAMIFPAVFNDFFQSSGDYSGNFATTTFFRILRYLCFILSIIFPGFYISLVMFHPEMIPYPLAIRIAATRIVVPFPAFLEAIAMSLAFFALLQASLMINQNVGSAISIVGGLVLGQAAISAGLISPAVIVIVAASSIFSLVVPLKELNMIGWIFQFICTTLSALFGLLGLVIVLLIILFMLARLTPLGVPYLAPFAGTRHPQLADTFVKYPENLIKERPLFLDPKNRRRRP